jgi:hypothetical protein
MSDDEVVSDVVQALVAEAEEDWVGLWQIARGLARRRPDADDAEIRRLGERVVRDMVDAGLRIGGLESGPGFTPWEGDDTVERVLAIWDELGRRPTLNEDIWFDLPEGGTEP